MRRRVSALLFVLLALGVSPAEADELAEDQVAALARDQLLRNARRQVEPDLAAAGATLTTRVEDLRRMGRERLPGLEAVDPKGVAGMRWFLGLDESDEAAADAPDPRGALAQAAWLHLWLKGEHPGGRLVLRLPDAAPGPDATFAVTPDAWAELEAEEKAKLLRSRTLDLLRLGDRGREPPQDVDLEVEGGVDPVAYLRRAPETDAGLALVHPAELEDEVSPAWLALRAEQTDARVAAWREDRPTDLVSQTQVTDRERRAEALEAEVEVLEARRQLVLAGLDAMVDAERSLRLHVYELESRRKEATEGEAPEPESEAAKTLERLEFEEAIVRRKQQLLYLTAWRADARLQLHDAALELSRREVVEARTVEDLFRQRLSRVRREYEIDRLALEQVSLAKEQRAAAAKVADAQEGVDVAPWVTFEQLLGEVGGLNASLRRLIEIRRTLDVRVRPDDENAEQGTTEAPTPPAETAARAGALLRDPDRHIHRPSYVEFVRESIDDPLMDEALVARIYAAADDRIRAWDLSLEDAQVAGSLRASFDAKYPDLVERSQALGALLPAKRWELVREVPGRLEEYAQLVLETYKGIVAKREEIVAQRDDLSRLCSELMGLGERSFGIRVDRNLELSDLRAAGNDLGSTATTVLRWLTLQGESHLGTWLAGNWARLLALLAAAVAGICGVRYARRRLDAGIQRLAYRVPELDVEHVTIADERDDVRELEEQADEAAKEAEATALRQATREEMEEEQSQQRVHEGDEAEGSAGDGDDR